MFAAVREHGLVLTPHNTRPDAARRPQARTSRTSSSRAPTTSASSASARARSPTQLLDWWGERLERDCIVDPERGFFVDQRWIDLVPGHGGGLPRCCATRASTSPTGTSPRGRSTRARRHAGASSATCRCGCSTSAASTPPSRTCSPSTRTASAWPTSPTSRSCASDYAAELLENGVDEVSGWPYTYDASASGIPLDQLHAGASTATLMRRRLRRRRCSTPDGEAAFLDRLQRARRRSAASSASRATWRRCTTLRGRPAGAPTPTSPTPTTRAASSAGRTSSARARGRRSPRRCCRRAPSSPRAADARPSPRRRGRPPPRPRWASTSPATSTPSSASARSRARSSTRSTPRGVPTLPVGLHARRRAARATRSRTSAPSPRRLPHQPRVRQRRHAARPRRAGRAGVLRGPPHDRPVVVGGRRRSPSAGTARSTTSTSCGRAVAFVAETLAAVSPDAGRAHADAGHAAAG